MFLTILEHFAVYFIIWWITLFIVLPIGMRTQEEENEIVPGTVESAPAHFRGARVVLATTAIAAVIHVGWYVVTTYSGFTLSSLPSIVPEFK